MSGFKLFYLKFCPYCQEVFTWIEEIKQEYPELKEVDLELINEVEHKELSDSLDYYYVPTFYYNDDKLFEGAMTKEDVMDVFTQAMDRQSQDN